MALEKQNPPYDSKIDPKVLRILHFYDSSSYPSLQLIYISRAYYSHLHTNRSISIDLHSAFRIPHSTFHFPHPDKLNVCNREKFKESHLEINLSKFSLDTSVERNTLMERVYPRLKSYCQERGYDFQVVDMRWGVRDESTDDHMTTELCMRELRACQKLSTGPNFIVSIKATTSQSNHNRPSVRRTILPHCTSLFHHPRGQTQAVIPCRISLLSLHHLGTSLRKGR